LALSWTALVEENPLLARQVSVLSSAVRIARRQPDAEDHFYRLRPYLLGPSALEALVEWIPGPETLLGVGYVIDEGQGPIAAVFVDNEGPPWGTTDTTTIDVAMEKGAGSRPGPLAAVSLPRAMSYAGPGDPCHGTRLWGTFGARVNSPSVPNGALTAGHVVGPAGSTVHDQNGQPLGKVAARLDPANEPPLTPTPDVALVQFNAGVTTQGVAHGTTTGTARPRDDVEIHGAKTLSSMTWIRGASPSWAGPLNLPPNRGGMHYEE